MKKRFRIEGWLALLTIVAAVSGAFLRRYQLLYELRPDGGLAPDSVMHTALTALTAVLLAALIAFLLPLQKKTRWAEVFSAPAAAHLLQLLAAALLVVGNVLLWVAGGQALTIYSTSSPALSGVLPRMLPPLGILSAACIASHAVLSLRKSKPSPLLYMVASIYLILRLIVCFQEWNTDPSIHDYGFQLLAAICCMLATFQLAGFSFDRGKRRMSLFWTLLAVVFCAVTVPDTLIGGSADMALINAGLLLSMTASGAQLLFAPSSGGEEGMEGGESEPAAS